MSRDTSVLVLYKSKIIAEREARRIVLPDSGPRGYIRYNMSATDVGWTPPGGVKTIKKKTMHLHGRAWPLQRVQLFLEQDTSRDVCRARDRPLGLAYGRLGSLISRGHRYCRY